MEGRHGTMAMAVANGSGKWQIVRVKDSREEGREIEELAYKA